MTNRSYSSTVTTRRHLWKAFWSVQDAKAVETVLRINILNVCWLKDSTVSTDWDGMDYDMGFQHMCLPELYGNSDLQSMSCSQSSKRAVISLRSDTGQICKHVLPYDHVLNATVLHINHKENNLYVRPDIFEEKAMILDSRLSCISDESLEPLGSRNVKIGQVYLVLTSTSSYARAVCGHMKYTHQNIMYFIDDGRLEFIKQNDIFLLPFALGLIPPVCVPLDLASCRKSLAFSTCVDHFRSLQVGSRILFTLKDRIVDLEARSSNNNNNQNEHFPLTFTSKIYVGESVKFEITCPKNGMNSENTGFNFGVLYDQWSSFTAFPSIARQKTLPCDVDARVAHRCDREGIYWMVDEKILEYVDEVLTQPSNYLGIDDAGLKFYPCIAYVNIDNDSNHLVYCRVLLRNFNLDSRRCSIFLVDYARFMTCDIRSLFTLEGQPSAVYETPGAAFLSIVRSRDSNGVVQQAHAYLCEGVTYSITLLSVDNEGIFCSSVFFPTIEDLLDDFKNRNVLVNQEPMDNSGSVVSCCSPSQPIDSKVVLFQQKCKDEKSEKEDEVLTDVKAALLKLEDKVTKCYDDLYRKLELLNIHDRKMLHDLSFQKNSDFAGRMKNNPFRLKKSFTRSDRILECSASSPIQKSEEGCVVQSNFNNDVLEELCHAKAGLLKDYKTLVNQTRNLSKERGRRSQISRKHESVQGGGRSEYANVRPYSVEEFHRSEGSSSSADSGIEHSDEHSPSPRALSPFNESEFSKYKKEI
uniref:Tudor domain-containing protein n=1 Tax=Syphacia muris TaxID=451379 RepID=A0A0N5AWJ5_9BILA